jgi:hypothetical protein
MFSLGMLAPNMKAIAEGKSAAYTAFKLIDRVCEIKVDE